MTALRRRRFPKFDDGNLAKAPAKGLAVTRVTSQCLSRDRSDLYDRSPLRDVIHAATVVPIDGTPNGADGASGYTYVLDQFQFHMTLAGPVPDGNISIPKPSLSRDYGKLARSNVELDSFSLVRQDERNRRFRLIGRYWLRGEF